MHMYTPHPTPPSLRVFTRSIRATRTVLPLLWVNPGWSNTPKLKANGTKYSRFHPANYLSHHLAGIVTAAVFADAAHIVEEIVLLKTRVTAAAAADPTERARCLLTHPCYRTLPASSRASLLCVTLVPCAVCRDKIR
jgi:hypothetical protein